MVAPASTLSRVTPEQLLLPPDRERFELVNGVLQELPEVSLETSLVASRLTRFLDRFVDEPHLGFVFNSDASYQCYPRDLERVRRPDVSVVRKGRHSREQLRRGHCEIAPDLAVEVISRMMFTALLSGRLLNIWRRRSPWSGLLPLKLEQRQPTDIVANGSSRGR